MFKEELNYFQSVIRKGLGLDKNIYCEICDEVNPCRFMPSPEAGPYWRCSECGEIVTEVRVLNVDYTITLEKPLDFIHFDLTSTTDGECANSKGTFVESHSLPKIATECGNVLTTDGNGHFYWLPPYHEDMEVEKQEEKFCQRCNNKLEVIKSKISIFSDEEEEVFKCTKCGWC